MIYEKLKDHLAAFSSAPFLFVGSGLSRRYIGLDTWNDLLKGFAADLPKPYGYYYSKADGKLPLVATLMTEDFHELWWSSDKFQSSRIAHEEIAKRKDSPLKIEISRFVSKMKPASGKTALQAEVASLKDVTIDGIITTNWDAFLARLCTGQWA